ncbi:MAG: hydrogenase nickel incorporation protein HypB [Bacillota bacterium]
MDALRVIEVKKSVYANNDLEAQENRDMLKEQDTYMMNLMSSPGSGKTTMLVSTLERLKEKIRIGIIEADIDSDVDALTIQTTGVDVIQIHNGGMCHLDAAMVRQSLDDIESSKLDFVVVENIGNLICPASYDLGQNLNCMILSVPEGDDKPLKYPKMFKKVDVLLVSKIDTTSVFDFDFNALEKNVRKLNPDIKIFPLSAKTGEGMEAWTEYLLKKIENGVHT